MARRKYNHASRIVGTQPGKIKAVYPGMFIRFVYRKSTVFDRRPILFVLYREYSENLLHGININYLSDFQLKQILTKITAGAGVYSESTNEFVSQDQTDDYDDSLPYRNLLKEPYSRVKLPVFKEKRDGNPISKAEAKKQMKILYEKVIKKNMRSKNLDIYRTYQINLMSEIKVLQINY